MSVLQKMLSFLTLPTVKAQWKLYKDPRMYSQKLTEKGRRLEGIIRNALAENNHEKIGKIVSQLCHDYAYAVHAPHARNGGLIGLAAAAIALGSVRACPHEVFGIGLTGPGSSPLPQGDSTSCPRLLL
jgi:hypothetical protein